MKRLLKSSMRYLGGIVLFAVVIAGCGRAANIRDSTKSDSSHGPPPPERDTSRVTLLREAEESYEYGPERPPLTAKDTAFPGPHVPDGSIPRMWIATAKWKGNGPEPAHRILARIRSEGPYPNMGIAAGYNYVSRDSGDALPAAGGTAAVVSSNKSMRSHHLTRDARKMEYSHGDRREPRLVILTVQSLGLGLCLDDQACLPSGHCGYY